jgi:hypothetical protein
VDRLGTSLSVVFSVIIYPDGHASSRYKIINLSAPLRKKTFHSKSMLQKRPFGLIIGLLKDHFMYRFMQDPQSIKGIFCLHESGLWRLNYMICYSI